MHLQGRGVLPTLTVTEPSGGPGADGSIALPFPRLLPGASAQRTVKVANNGAIAASAQLSIAAPDSAPSAAQHFALVPAASGAEDAAQLSSPSNMSITLSPGQEQAVAIEYRPQGTGVHSAFTTLAVAQNPFEQTRLALRGECAADDLALVGLPGGEASVLRLPDCALGEQQVIDFRLQNNASAALRVTWPTHANLTAEPATQHIPAGTIAPMRITFAATTAAALNGVDFVATAAQITTADGSAPTASWRSDSGEPEPKVTAVKGTEKKAPLKVFAVANDARYECATREVAFKPTPMFQARTTTVTFKNAGTTRLPWSAQLRTPDGEADTSGLYTVRPAEGHVEPGKDATLTLRFAPHEVVDCRRRLHVAMPGLPGGATPLNVELSGRVQRPWCHFEVRSNAVSELVHCTRNPACRAGLRMQQRPALGLPPSQMLWLQVLLRSPGCAVHTRQLDNSYQHCQALAISCNVVCAAATQQLPQPPRARPTRPRGFHSPPRRRHGAGGGARVRRGPAGTVPLLCTQPHQHALGL